MEDNKKFELGDETLDQVAGGVGSEDEDYSAIPWSVGEAVSVPYCSAKGCGGLTAYNAVITGFGSVSKRGIRTGELKVYLRMDCCGGETHRQLKDLRPYVRITYM